MVDPFFSTRVKGRGLGLAVVIGAVRAHEGAVQIESEEERGTCFRILLPIAKERPSQDELAPSSDGLGARRRVLVVDDDPGAREVTATSLKRAGFEVVEARDGLEAISLYERSRGRIDAVVLDGTMPGMSGAHVFDALRKIAPKAKVILVSGYETETAAGALWGVSWGLEIPLMFGPPGFKETPTLKRSNAFESDRCARAIQSASSVCAGRSSDTI